MKTPFSEPKGLWGTLALISGAVVVSLLSPPEKTLGNIAKFIYLHAALSWVGIATFSVAGVVAAAFLLSRKNVIFVWADAFEKTALLLWSTHFVMGMVSMQIAWGGIFWQEPRFLTATLILLVSLALYSIARAFSKPLLSATVYLTTAAATWGLLLNSERVFHPANPIMGGQSLIIKIYAAVITGLLMLTAFSIAFRFKEASRNELFEIGN